MMTLKPFRSTAPWDEVNLYALNEGSGNKGEFVQMISFDPDNHNGYGAALPGTPAGAFSADYIVNARVKLATSGATSDVLGMLLFDVRTNLPYMNTPANLADPIRLAEQQVVPSGRAVPILTRGMVEIGGFSGTPGPGSTAFISNVAPGHIRVGATGAAGAVGTFMSSTGVDGHAILFVHAK